MTPTVLRRLALVLLLFTAFTASAEEAATTSGSPPDQERIAAYEARFGRLKPLVAVVGHNGGTELTDFVIPYGVLSESGAADVVALATETGPLHFRPALTIEAQATTEQFDQRFPDGADYVIVPAVRMDKIDDSTLLGWLQGQAGKGATIVSICDGALVVAKAGLFKGHRATGHWATQGQRERDFPDTQWLKNTLALTADAFSRTYRSRVYSVAAAGGAVRTAHGLTLVPDRSDGATNVPHRMLPPGLATGSVQALDQSLAQIADLYGKSTADFVSVQLEYPGFRSSR